MLGAAWQPSCCPSTWKVEIGHCETVFVSSGFGQKPCLREYDGERGKLMASTQTATHALVCTHCERIPHTVNIKLLS